MQCKICVYCRQMHAERKTPKFEVQDNDLSMHSLKTLYIYETNIIIVFENIYKVS